MAVLPASRSPGGDGLTPVAVCDDHPALREGLDHILTGSGEFAVVSSTSRGADLLTDLDHLHVDLLILDLALPDITDTELITAVSRRHPCVRTLIFTASSVARAGIKCIRAGAHGFLSKSASPEEIIEALRTLRRGDAFAGGDLVGLLIAEQGDGPRTRYANLSPREQEVFERLACGVAVTEIAAELHVDQRTVSTHRRHIFDKLDINSNAELVAFAIRHELVDPETLTLVHRP